MGKGQASGLAAEYQVLSQSIMQAICRAQGHELVPFGLGAAPGIDLPFEVGGTVWRFDLALGEPGAASPSLVAECRRWAQAAHKQEHTAAFAWRVHLLREQYGAVDAYYFAKKQPHRKQGPKPSGTFQAGTIAAATFADIVLYEMPEAATPEHFRLERHHIVNGGRTMTSHVWSTARGSIGVKGMSTGFKGPARTES